MVVPAEAFADRMPHEMSPGSIFRLRESWAVVVNYMSSDDSPAPGFIMLQGDRVGTLFRLSDRMAPCITLADQFSWFPAIKPGAIATSNGLETSSLTLTKDGPVIMGRDPERWGRRDTFAFDSNGVLLAETPQGAVKRFSTWTAELCHLSRPFVTMGQLFEVDRT